MVCSVVNAAGCSAADHPGPAPDRCGRRPLPAFVLGANVIDHLDDDARGFGTKKSRTTLRRLAGLGLTGVVLPVSLTTPGLSATEVAAGPRLYGAGRARLVAMIDQAKQERLLVTVVPHVLLDDGQWRGDLAPAFDGVASEAAWRAWWDSYAQLVLVLAEAAEEGCADVLSLGIEFKSFSREPFAAAWMDELADDVGQVFGGALTYSANWDEVEIVPFWESLDVVGINAFYPLVKKGAPDDQAALFAGAARIHEGLATMFPAQRVWFIELGFKSTVRSYDEPWKWIDEVPDDAVSERAQLLGYQAHARALRAQPAVDGVFFWAVPADPDDRAHAYKFEDERGFSFLDKPAEAVVRDLAQAPPAR